MEMTITRVVGVFIFSYKHFCCRCCFNVTFFSSSWYSLFYFLFSCVSFLSLTLHPLQCPHIYTLLSMTMTVASIYTTAHTTIQKQAITYIHSTLWVPSPYIITKFHLLWLFVFHFLLSFAFALSLFFFFLLPS